MSRKIARRIVAAAFAASLTLGVAGSIARACGHCLRARCRGLCLRGGPGRPCPG
jgi:hypothetical protein